MSVTFGSYRVNVINVQCVMPSSSTETKSPERAAIAKQVLEAAGKVVEVIPEIGEIAGPVLEVAGALTEGVADLVAAIDKARRDAGLDPDNLYVTSFGTAGPVEEKDVVWPGGDPTVATNRHDLAKGQQAGGAPLFSALVPKTGGLAFWDYDNPSSDDLCARLQMNAADVGAGVITKTLYSPDQDATYTLTFTVDEAN